jgi:hypothetical protein
MSSFSDQPERENLAAVEALENPDINRQLIAWYAKWSEDHSKYNILKQSTVLNYLHAELKNVESFVPSTGLWKAWAQTVSKEGLTAFWANNYIHTVFSPASYPAASVLLNVPLSELPAASERSDDLILDINLNPNPPIFDRKALAFGGLPVRENLGNIPCVVLPQFNQRWSCVAYDPEAEADPENQLLGQNRSTAPLFDEDEILNFTGDPDDKSFVPCSRATVDRAKEFLSAYAGAGVKNALLPRVSPGPNGSIDMHWNNKKKELLINIPADSGKPITFYGDDFGDQKITGSVHVGMIERLIAYWLVS